jgi:hypothetical protein
MEGKAVPGADAGTSVEAAATLANVVSVYDAALLGDH